MRHIFCMSILGFALSACTYDPVPPHIQKRVDAIPASELPTSFMAERDLCPPKRKKSHNECVERVRRESLARELTRKEANSEPQKIQKVK